MKSLLSQTELRGVARVGVFLVIRAKRRGIGRDWNSNQELAPWWKIVPPRQRSLSNSSHDFLRCLPPHPAAADSQSLCPGGTASTCPKQHHFYRGAALGVRLDVFFFVGVGSACPGHPNSTGRLWQKRISYAVISCNRRPHQN